MTIAQLGLIFRILTTIIPTVIQLVMTNKLKTAAFDEVLNALVLRFEDRIRRAEAATKDLPDEASDPDNRSR